MVALFLIWLWLEHSEVVLVLGWVSWVMRGNFKVKV